MSTELEADMSINGFLSEKLDDFIPEVIAGHKALFDFALRINRTSVRAWLDMGVPASGTPFDAPEVLANRIFARAFTSFEASVILLRRGMVIEGGLVARAVFEAAFWLGYFAKDASAAKEALHVDGLRSELSRLEAFKPHRPHVPNAIDPTPRIDALRLELAKRRRPSIEEVARGGDLDSLYAFYLDLCGRAAHVSMMSTNYYLENVQPGEARHTIGPDVESLDYFLTMACFALLAALTALAHLSGIADTQSAVAELKVQWLEFN